MLKAKPKIIIVMGPTASGKSDFAIELIKKKLKNKGEIISADSRQVYKCLKFFSGAISKEKMLGVKHHLVSFLKLNEKFTVFDFQKQASKKIDEILKKDMTPVIVGGSSFFIESLIYKNLLPEIVPNNKLRRDLENKTVDELFEILKKKDKKRAEGIDRKNKRRIIRSLEIIEEIGFFPIIERELNKKYDWNIYFLEKEKKELNKKIELNFLKRVDFLLEEADNLKNNLSDQDFKQLGLAYKNIYNYWDGKINKEEFIRLGIKEEQKYAKRQRTFLKKFLNNLPKGVKINILK